MIDTIKVKIPISLTDWASVQHLCDRSEKSPTDKPRTSIYYKQMVFEKRAKAQITLGKEDSIFVELSLPKYWNGHNVYVLTRDEQILAIEDLQNVLIDFFNINIPDYKDWLLRRIDFCYNWRFQDDDIALAILSGLKPYGLPKKKQIIYDTSIYWRGGTKNTKVYLKHPEFMKKNYKELHKWGFGSFAELINKESVGVLRYEVELQDEAIIALFGGKDTPLSKLLFDFDCMKYLQQNLHDLIGNVDNEDIQSWSDVYAYILQTTPRRQAWGRFAQLLLSTSTIPVIHDSINIIPRSTRKRNEQYYRENNLIALPFTLPYKYKLEIPSPLEPLPSDDE